MRVVSCAVGAGGKVRLSVFTLVSFISPTSFLSSLCVSLLEWETNFRNKRDDKCSLFSESDNSMLRRFARSTELHQYRHEKSPVLKDFSHPLWGKFCSPLLKVYRFFSERKRKSEQAHSHSWFRLLMLVFFRIYSWPWQSTIPLFPWDKWGWLPK